jgi:hypothetical protein
MEARMPEPTAVTDRCTAVARSVAAAFATQRALGERAIAQTDDVDLFRSLDGDGNSIAALMKHIGGNLRSRWTEPFTTDGEKPDRNRDAEFEPEHDSADDVRTTWRSGWAVLDRLLESLAPDDFDRQLRIRGEVIPLLDALHRSLAHTAQHVGQIVLLARHWRGDEWQTLSIPKRKRDR